MICQNLHCIYSKLSHSYSFCKGQEAAFPVKEHHLLMVRVCNLYSGNTQKYLTEVSFIKARGGELQPGINEIGGGYFCQIFTAMVLFAWMNCYN